MVVGVENNLTKVKQRLKEVKILGLVGMGGIGKSTLARELYNRMTHKFGASCFIEDVQAKVRQGGMDNEKDCPHWLVGCC